MHHGFQNSDKIYCLRANVTIKRGIANLKRIQKKENQENCLHMRIINHWEEETAIIKELRKNISTRTGVIYITTNFCVNESHIEQLIPTLVQ